ncbi:MAG: Wadjet anti-phage system protein JetA family protein [Verrucomicrobiota bacterium]
MLGAILFNGDVTPEFFRLPSGSNARVYVDTLDSLARELGEATLGISRQEAVEVVLQVVEHHAGLRLDDEENPAVEDLGSPRGQANFLLNRLIAAKWFSEPQRPDYQRIVYLERQGEILLDALRRIAKPDAAQLGNCARSTMRPGVPLSKSHLPASSPWWLMNGISTTQSRFITRLKPMLRANP